MPYAIRLGKNHGSNISAFDGDVADFVLIFLRVLRIHLVPRMTVRIGCY